MFYKYLLSDHPKHRHQASKRYGRNWSNRVRQNLLGNTTRERGRASANRAATEKRREQAQVFRVMQAGGGLYKGRKIQRPR